MASRPTPSLKTISRSSLGARSKLTWIAAQGSNLVPGLVGVVFGNIVARRQFLESFRILLGIFVADPDLMTTLQIGQLNWSQSPPHEFQSRLLLFNALADFFDKTFEYGPSRLAGKLLGNRHHFQLARDIAHGIVCHPESFASANLHAVGKLLTRERNGEDRQSGHSCIGKGSPKATGTQPGRACPWTWGKLCHHQPLGKWQDIAFKACPPLV
jgi:hypothetical protein